MKGGVSPESGGQEEGDPNRGGETEATSAFRVYKLKVDSITAIASPFLPASPFTPPCPSPPLRWTASLRLLR